MHPDYDKPQMQQYQREMLDRAACQPCGPSQSYPGEEPYPDQLGRAVRMSDSASSMKGAHTPILPRTTEQIQRLERIVMELREELQQGHSQLDGFFGYADVPPMAQPENRAISNPSDFLASLVDLVADSGQLAAQLRRRLADYL